MNNNFKWGVAIIIFVIVTCCCCATLPNIGREPGTTTAPSSTASPTDLHYLSTAANTTPTASPTISASSQPSLTVTATATLTPSPTTPEVEGAGCIPSYPPQTALFSYVIDGDTIEVLIDGQPFRVRYIGMDTPEFSGDTVINDLAQQAADANLALLKIAGGELTLFKDVSETDRYGRLLRYVIAGNVFVNYQMVALGYAQTASFPPDIACIETFLAAEGAARQQLLGLWAPPPDPLPLAPTLPVKSGEICDVAYPDVCIPPSPPDLDCGDITYRRFRVLPPDPHRFDGDGDGIGCES